MTDTTTGERLPTGERVAEWNGKAETVGDLLDWIGTDVAHLVNGTLYLFADSGDVPVPVGARIVLNHRGGATLVEQAGFQAHIYDSGRCIFCNLNDLDDFIDDPYECIKRGQFTYTTETPGEDPQP